MQLLNVLSFVTVGAINPFLFLCMDTCPDCSSDPCTCNTGGDFSPDAPGAA